MPEKPKKTVAKPRKKRGNYEEPLKVNGSFLDIVKSAVKDAEKKPKKK